MKIIIFFFVLFLSKNAFAYAYDDCVVSQFGLSCTDHLFTNDLPVTPLTGNQWAAIYDPEFGETKILPVKPSGEIIDDGYTTKCTTVNLIETCINTYPDPVEGTWSNKTNTCSNFAIPIVKGGFVTCPAQGKAKTVVSKVDHNPSLEDLSCDPTLSTEDLKEIEDEQIQYEKDKLLNPKLKPPAARRGGCASEKTAKDANTIASEANSKLGSVASSTATISGNLASIDGKLGSIAAACEVNPDVINHVIHEPDTSGKYCEEFNTNQEVDVVDSALTSSGSCPADISMTVIGKSYMLSYQSACDFAEGMSGVVKTIGTFSALMIVITAL